MTNKQPKEPTALEFLAVFLGINVVICAIIYAALALVFNL